MAWQNGVCDGMRTGKSKNDPDLKMTVGSLEGNFRILRVTQPKYSDYMKLWYIEFCWYHEPGPCPCCGQPRGAGSLHK
jgi:hypothetical protein